MVFYSKKYEKPIFLDVLSRYCITFFGEIAIIYVIQTIFFIERQPGKILISKWDKVKNGFENMNFDERINAFFLAIMISTLLTIIVMGLNNRKNRIIAIAFNNNLDEIKIKTKNLFSSTIKTMVLNTTDIELVDKKSSDGLSWKMFNTIDLIDYKTYVGSIYLSEAYWTNSEINQIRHLLKK